MEGEVKLFWFGYFILLKGKVTKYEYVEKLLPDLSFTCCIFNELCTIISK